MEKFIKKMEEYANENNIPIMQKEGITFLQQYIKDNSVTSILEIGTAIGYSAIQMGRVSNDIQIDSIEKDQERYHEAVKNCTLCKMENRIHCILGDALTYEIKGKYDLIFIDAAKAQYIKFFNKYAQNLQDNGTIISDNLKFHGLVETQEKINNRNTRQLVKKIKKYLSFLKENNEYETIIYDCGDGIAVTKKKNA